MSDDGDGDELGRFDSVEPLPRVKKPNFSRSTRTNSRTEAGSKTKSLRKNAPIPISDDSEMENANPFDFTGLDDDDDDGGRRTNLKTKPVQNVQDNLNGKHKGNGKAKASQSKSLQKQAQAQPIEVLDDVNDEHLETADDRATTRKRQRLSPNDARTTRNGDIDRMADQLRRAEEQIKALSKQLEEAFSIRETEPEKLLRDLEARHEAQLHAQEALIKELTSQISMKVPIMSTGNATVLNLLTREAADEEKRALEQQIGRWKDSAEELKRTIKDRDDRIHALEQKEKDLAFQLNAEIERSASLSAKASRHQPQAPRGGRSGGVDDPRHAEVLRFYEDVTNLLVPHMKTQTGQHLGMEDWVLFCIYTFIDDTADDPISTPQKSLSFTLRLCHEPPNPQDDEPITSKDQLIPTVHFTPLELDKESPDFVSRLDFLQTPFSFGRNQLPLFLRTMYKRMRRAVLEIDGDDDSDEN